MDYKLENSGLSSNFLFYTYNINRSLHLKINDNIGSHCLQMTDSCFFLGIFCSNAVKKRIFRHFGNATKKRGGGNRDPLANAESVF